MRTHLKPRQAELLVALAEERHLGRAAERTCMTQPAASKALAQIEEGVGLTLFERTAQGTVPTPAGEVMVAHARHQLGAAARIAAELEALRARQSRLLRLGTLASTAVSVAPRLVEHLTAADPRLDIILVEGLLHELIARLRDDGLDMVLGRLENRGPDDELEEVVLYAEPIAVVCRRGHPLAAAAPVGPAGAAGFGWILPHEGTLLLERLAEFFRQGDIGLPPARVRSNSLLANLEMVRATDWLVAMPLAVARTAEARGDVAVLPLASELNFGPVGAVLRRNRLPLGPVDAALDWLRAAAAAGCRSAGAGRWASGSDPGNPGADPGLPAHRARLPT